MGGGGQVGAKTEVSSEAMSCVKCQHHGKEFEPRLGALEKQDQEKHMPDHCQGDLICPFKVAYAQMNYNTT